MIHGFFQFIPVNDNNKEILNMDEVTVGKLYEIVATDTSNNCFYKTKDVIKVVGFIDKVPLIRFSYRKEQLINVGGIDFYIYNILNIVRKFENNPLINGTDYTICVDNINSKNKIVLIVEAENDKLSRENENELSILFRKELSNENTNYDLMYINEKIDKAVVKIYNKGEYRKIRNMRIKKGIPIDSTKAVRFINYTELVS